jgi:hypothetical protein
MKKTKLSLAVAGLMLVSAIAITSCKKSTTTTTPATDTSTTSSTDNNLAQQNAHDITNFGSEGIDNSTLTSYKLANGTGQPSVLSGVSGTATVVINPTAKTATVTFINFIGYDGHTRNGTVMYDWSASLSTPTYTAQYYRDSGMVINITTPTVGGVVYTVDNNTVHVNSKTIKNIGRVNGQLTWTDNSNITITKTNNGGTIQWQGNWSVALLNTSAYTYTTFNGTASSYTYPGVFTSYGGPPSNYIDWTKALVSVSGTFSGTAADGETYTGNISTPLILNFNCTPQWSRYLYVSGVLNFTPTGKATRTINYGTGVCDLTYVVSIGSYSITITI